jgi:AcrR family transcriptional regulator
MPRKTADTPTPPLELRDACIVAAREVIAERGVEQLSLREVARKLGVSHQAPYRHYPSRDHLLAEVMRRCFEHFAQFLDAREHFDDPSQDLASLGAQYLLFASRHPLEYRLMFGTAWPEPAMQPALVRDATHAFDVLRSVLRRLHGPGADTQALVDLDAMTIWSMVHGLAGVMSGPCLDQLGLSPTTLAQAVPHAMQRLGAALHGAAATPAPPPAPAKAAAKAPARRRSPPG